MEFVEEPFVAKSKSLGFDKDHADRRHDNVHDKYVCERPSGGEDALINVALCLFVAVKVTPCDRFADLDDEGEIGAVH